MLGVTDGVIRLDYQNEDMDLLSYPRCKEIPFTAPCTFIHEDEYGCIWINPAGGEFCFYNPVTRKLEQAYIYDDMGERKLVSLPAFSYMIDQHHNLWYNHDGFGYISFHQKNIDYITNTPKGMARALTEDHQNAFGLDGSVIIKDNREIFVFMIH